MAVNRDYARRKSSLNHQYSTFRGKRAFTKYNRVNSRARTIFVRTYRWVCFFALGLLFASLAPQIEARKHSTKKAAHKEQQSPAQIEAAARLQIFLDRSNFSPGKIDGRYNEFTWKALALYRQSRGEQPRPPPPAKANAAPDIRGLDLASVKPVFITYSVTPADLQNVGKLPASSKEQAKLKALLYRDPADAIAEKFHCDIHFLEQLNPSKTKSIKPGDQLRVPSVEPFELGEVKDVKPGSEINAPAANELPDEPDKTPAEHQSSSQNPSAAPPSPPSTSSVKVDTKTNMLGVFEADKLIAAYPVTIGSAQTASPIGDWKVKGIARWPRFRYDEKMLKQGERSGHFYMLPPGPRSPVGVLWIALNKKGIGIHGTASPDSIGKSVSHGCIRLANWDVVRLAERVKFGTAVSIH
jgi:lipoprotein-anchoring transpeptidase ErfK/SrfK